jgi:oleate hydratase
LELIELMAAPEAMLGARRIQDHFNPAFFKTNFWYMWATTFAFQPWHSAVECKRYLHRFIQSSRALRPWEAFGALPSTSTIRLSCR